MGIDIYGTLGPACQKQELLEEMFACGMTGMRLNLSHIGLWGCEEWLAHFQGAARRAETAPKLLIDLQGPELRIGNISPKTLEKGMQIGLVADSLAGQSLSKAGERMETLPVPGIIVEDVNPESIPVPPMVIEALTPGQQILLDDGKILLETLEGAMEEKRTENPGADGLAGRRQFFVACRVLRGGLLKPRKSIALPGCKLHPPTLTGSDLANLRLAKKYGVTGVMLPFVRDAEDLKTLRRALQEEAGDIRIFAKIENREGIDKLPELLPHADEIVIARGDLGNAMPLWELPKAQYEIGALCKKAEKPYMVVTQMLASMEHTPVPTRAEVSDIFYAVLHGASSVMLTGETAAGEYPVEAMNYMCRTVEAALAQKRELEL